MTPPQMVDAYCEPYIGGDSRFPLVRLKPRGSIKRCPLLKDRKCSVHNAKPTVCAMFPIGRCVASEIKPSKKNTDDKFPIGEIQYIFSDPHCGDYSKTYTVREWLQEFNLELEDEFFIKWNQTLIRCQSAIKKAEKRFAPQTMDMLWNAVYISCYLDYDMSKDFMQQFIDNTEKLNDIMDMINHRYKK